MEYPKQIVENGSRILNTDGGSIQVRQFPGKHEVEMLVNSLKMYDPDYNESVQSKSYLKRMSMIFEFFNSRSHCQMTQYTVEFRYVAWTIVTFVENLVEVSALQ